jgi:hypothetical protein
MSWNLVEDVNAVIFHQLEDNLSCQETGEEVAIVSSKKLDPSCRGHLFLEHRPPAMPS